MPCRPCGARAGADQRLAVLQPLTQTRVDRHAHEAAGFEIPEQVTAEQPLRQRGLPRTDGEMHLVRRRQLLGDLVARVPTAHHQHGPAGNVGRPAVVGAVHLDEARVELLGDGRDPRRLKRPRGDHHLVSGVRTVAQLDHEAPVVAAADREDLAVELHGQVEVLRVARQVLDNLVAARIGVELAGEREPGQAVVAHRREQLQRVPPLAPLRCRSVGRLQNLEAAAVPGQEVPQGQPRLAAADHDDVVAVTGSGHDAPSASTTSKLNIMPLSWCSAM